MKIRVAQVSGRRQPRLQQSLELLSGGKKPATKMDFWGFGVRSPPSSLFLTNKEHFKADHYLHRYSSPRKSDGIREQTTAARATKGALMRMFQSQKPSNNIGIPLSSITSTVAFSDKYKVYNSNLSSTKEI